MKYKLYIFRVVSSRGTDFRHGFKLRADITDKEALEIAKNWAEERTRDTACRDYTVISKRVKHIPRPKWLSKWNAICKRYHKIKNEKEDLLAMNTAFDWTKV